MRTHHLLLPVAALLPLAACGEDDDDAKAADVVAVDYAFEDLPERVDAGATLTLENKSPGEVHELIAFRLPAGDERSAAEILALPEEQLFTMFGGEPDLVLIAPPGDTSFAAVGDGTLTEPGRYLVFCAIPKGADPAEYMRQVKASQDGPPKVDGGPPHFVEGMYAELVVE